MTTGLAQLLSCMAAIVCVTSSGFVAWGVTPTDAEMATAKRWSQAVFGGSVDEAITHPLLVVEANNDPVQVNARHGKPMNFGGTSQARGLYCHAFSRVRVRGVPMHGTLEAIVGVDSNEQTSGGRGSVVFRVLIDDAPAFTSPLLREGAAPVAISVSLGDASEFVLEVQDGGDGISCDQSDWSDARITYADGTVLHLDEFPVSGSEPLGGADVPFSFLFAGKPSGDLLKSWKRADGSVGLVHNQDDAEQREIRKYTTFDSEQGLAIEVGTLNFDDAPCSEWMLRLQNSGNQDTPLIENVMPLDITLPAANQSDFVLHHFTGSPYSATDYRPQRTVLGKNADVRISTNGGRPTNSDLPCFNIEYNNGGVILVLGWPGQWSARFERDGTGALRITGGQELTKFVLRPGESVRTPRVVMLTYQGDWIRGQNLWRRWMLAHNMPRPGGNLPPAQMAACSSHQFGEMINANTENQKFFVDRYLEEKLPLDYWWMDAGWYINETGWPNTGTWEVDEKRFPGGLRPISDHARAKGVKTIVWFEPERVTPGTWLYTNHPEWLLGKDGEQKLLNLGNDDARKWLSDHVNGLIDSQGIDLYRNDFNIDPLPFWRANDAEDRQGITEMKYVEGFLAYWDALREKHPNMLIDTCASGGRRNDIDTLKRSVPLLRSDFIIEPVSQQLHTYGINFWIPYYGTGVNSADPYVFRSQICPNLIACYDMRNREFDYESVRTLLAEWKKLSECYFGDYYPLTDYHTENDQWMAWQYDVPERGRGAVQVFRRANSPYESLRVHLRGLDESAMYELSRSGTNPSVLSGNQLSVDGVLIELGSKPEAAILFYEKSKR